MRRAVSQHRQKHRSLLATFSLLAIVFSASVSASLYLSVGDAEAAYGGSCVSSTGLEGYWKFNEATGLYALDSSGNSHVGTLVGGTLWASGSTLISSNSGSLLFDGTDDHVAIAGSNDFTYGTGSFTVSLFVKTDTGNRSVLGNYNAGAGWGLYLYSDGKVNFFGYGDMGTNDTAQSSVALNNQWHHIVGVFTRTGNDLKIDTYVDGTLIGTHTATVGNITVSSDLLLGDYLGQPHFKGGLDEVRIYSRALTSTEVNALFNGCTSSSSSSSTSSSTSSSSSSTSSSSTSSSSSSSSSVTPGPMCNGVAATIYVKNNKIVGGPMNGMTYYGILRGGSGADVIVGTNKQDIIGGKAGNDTICGGNGNDLIYGDDGNDWLSGDNGNDFLLGGAGNDTLTSGSGKNFLDGGAGSNICHVGGKKDIAFRCQAINSHGNSMNHDDEDDDE